MNKIEQLQKFVDEVNTTNKTNEKLKILKKYPECKEIFRFIYNPFWKFGVTSKNCKKNKNLTGINNHSEIFSLFNDLINRFITGHDAIKAVNSFIEANKKYEDLLWLIIDRNLKTKVDAKAINKVWPGLIPEFAVALANKLTPKLKEKIEYDGSWFASRKIDGLRCVTIIKSKDDIKCMSRGGNEFTSLEKLKPILASESILNEIENISDGIVLDGEICIIEEDGSENFTAAVSQVKRKNVQVESPRYKLFDCIKLKDFLNKKSTEILSERHIRLKKIIPKCNELNILEQVPLTDESIFKKFQEDVAALGWEGFVIRKDASYKGKRSNDMLKIKIYDEAEFVVEGTEVGTKPMLNESGLSEERDCLAAVHIKFKGCDVRVGSGFSDEERLKFYSNPNEIIGKTITVSYFGESEDKSGKPSLRHPVIKCIFEGNRDV